MFFFFSLSFCKFNLDHQIVIDTKVPWYESTTFDQYFVGLAENSNKKAAEFFKNVANKHCHTDKTCMIQILNSILDKKSANTIISREELNDLLPIIEFNREQARSYRGSNFEDLFIVGSQPDFEYNCIYFNNENITVLPTEFQLGNKNTIVYANLSNPDTFNFVNNLIVNKKSFVLRPTSQGKFGLDVRGYGIELRPFKYSMEYGVKDDQRSSENSETNPEIYDETLSNFDNIQDMKPLQSDIHISKPAFTQYFDENEQPFLKKLTYIAENPSISLPILDSMYNEQENQNVSIDTTIPIKSINGRSISNSEIDTFTILNIINQERNAYEVLKNESHESLDMFKIELPDKTAHRFDYRNKFIAWKNNLEKDQISKDYKVAREELSNKNHIPRVKRNLFNLLVTADPTTQNGVYKYLVMEKIMDKGYPCRFGGLPVFNLNDPLSRKAAFAYAYIKQFSDSLAFDFLIFSAKFTGFDARTYQPLFPSEESIAKAYTYVTKTIKDATSWHDLYKYFSPLSKIHSYVKEMTQKVTDKKLNEYMTIFNGYVFYSLYTDSLDGLLYKEQDYLSSLIEENVIPENFDIFDVFNKFTYVSPDIESKYSLTPILSLHLLNQPKKIMKKFMNFLKNSFDDEFNDFVIVFTESNQEKIENQLKQLNVSYLINPKLPEKLHKALGIEKEMLIVNGRVFYNFDDIQKHLKWTQNFISRLYRKVDCKNYVKFFFYCLTSNFYENDIHRNKDSLIINENDRLSFESNSMSDFTFEFTCNPFDESVQKLIPIVNYLNEKDVIDVKIQLNIPTSVSGQSNNVYRMALDKSEVIFGAVDDLTTYSIIPHFPQTFVCEQMRSEFDADNILTSLLTPGIHKCSYILTNVVANGLTNSSGFAIYLGDKNLSKISGTFLSKSGYWQIQANPGLFDVVLSKEYISSYKTEKSTVFVNSFAQKDNFVTFSQFSSFEQVRTDPKTIETVDVFIVASGQLYERLAKIMMISVRRHTNSSVRFWILKNYLSPSFKASLPKMSQEYNFSYNLISYNWPANLFKQKEKNRIIWANKILFLDNIFPPDLKRVIYIDADQIVRSDLSELMKLDLSGAPYAFTPMCDSRTEIEPYRFWKRGYWQKQLRGKKYHISALFVVDLERFRQMDAGEILRDVYQDLAPDPNSLANLDQDLPNYVQDALPIYSLPQEWLWCETWCSDETMNKAKTIDLCNNPLTHKPKLEIALERVEEWPGLDEEARRITAKPDEYMKNFF